MSVSFLTSAKKHLDQYCKKKKSTDINISKDAASPPSSTLLKLLIMDVALALTVSSLFCLVGIVSSVIMLLSNSTHVLI